VTKVNIPIFTNILNIFINFGQFFRDKHTRIFLKFFFENAKMGCGIPKDKQYGSSMGGKGSSAGCMIAQVGV
jgi:hypothetical protein